MNETTLLKNLIVAAQAYLISSDRIQTCTNCSAWLPEEEHCTRFNTRPPAKVIVVGCEQWEPEIPF